jgi:DMSO/TMAO reductase YedYZ molybdopterin-dependent catalytic subunit
MDTCSHILLSVPWRYIWKRIKHLKTMTYIELYKVRLWSILSYVCP